MNNITEQVQEKSGREIYDIAKAHAANNESICIITQDVNEMRAACASNNWRIMHGYPLRRKICNHSHVVYRRKERRRKRQGKALYLGYPDEFSTFFLQRHGIERISETLKTCRSHIQPLHAPFIFHGATGTGKPYYSTLRRLQQQAGPDGKGRWLLNDTNLRDPR